jgi:small subunit ribosomal protein S20
MPRHKAAEKHLRVSKKRRIRNKAQKSETKTAIKRVLESEEKEKAQSAFASASSSLDRLARKGILHKNTVARTKSKLARKVNSLGA